MDDLISIVIPVYNIEKEVSRCLESVLNQTYANIEIIVVNDGSTDDSGIVIDQYADRYPDKVKVYHKTNGGVTSARLLGVKKAQGEWIGFVDGDDIIESDMYEFLLNNAYKYNAQISHCGYQMVFDDGHVNYLYNTGCLLEQSQKEAVVELLEGTRIEPGLCNKLFHRSLFVDLIRDNLIPLDIKNNEDLLMNYYLFSNAKKAVYEDQCKYHYLIRSNSASRKETNTHKIYNPIKVKKIILEKCDELIKKEAQRAYLTTCVYTYCGLSLADKKKYNKDRKQVRKYILDSKNWCSLLAKRPKVLAELIIYVPFLFQVIYPIYAKHIQEKKYD